MNIRKICCAALCGVLLLTAAACGGNANSDGDILPAGTEGPTSDFVTHAQTTEAASGSVWTTTAKETVSEPDVTQTTAEETTEEAKEIRLEDGLTSTDVEEVLTFYKLAAEKNQSPKYSKTLTLISLNSGEGKVAEYVDVFEPIAKKAVAKNTTTGDVLPGVQTAIDEMPGVSADFANGEMTIEYQNPTITVKVNNRTGEFVPGSGKWSYRVHPVLRYLEAKVLVWTVHLINADGYVDYAVTC